MKKYIAMSALVFGGVTVVSLWAMSNNGAAPAVATPAKVSARATKIAFFRPQGIKSEEFEEMAKSLQGDFEKRVMDLRKQREDLAQKTKTLGSAAADRDAIKDAVKQQNALEIEERSLQDDFQRYEQKIQMDMGQKMDKAVTTVVKAEGWDGAIPAVTSYVNSDVDITDRVTEELNKEFRKEKAARKFKKDTVAPGATRATPPAVTEKK